MSSLFDRLSERVTRNLARFTSRRSFLTKLSAALLAAPAFPLLPVVRTARAADAPKTDFELQAQSKDDRKCNYWKYCGSDGVMCSCCGGGTHTCPPGAELSPIAWFGTCTSADDGKAYIIAYRDCCGKPMCAADASCVCDNADRELPIYRAASNNDIIWCFGSSSAMYHCSTAALIGPAA